MPNLVPRLWPGETVACVACGPSLVSDDVEALRGRVRVIAINRSIEIAPWADVWYAADAKFWKWAHRGEGDWAPVKAITARYAGLKYSVTTESAKWPGVTVLGRGASTGLSLDPKALCLGGNGGYQAINLAVLLGATRILLLGYDMQVGTGGKQHWHADHPMRGRSPYQTFQANFPTIAAPLQAAGIEVINCSRRTALKCFPRQSIGEALGLPSMNCPMCQRGEPCAEATL